jgi:acylphosphatase
MNPVRMRVLIEGRLQGTNFRYYAQQQAQRLGIGGFVRTLSDGRIEIDMQGDNASVDQMLAWCHAEPHSSHIRTILYRYDDPLERTTDFSVR